MEITKNNLVQIEVKDGSDYASVIVTEYGSISHLTGWGEKVKGAAIEEVKKHFKGKCGKILYHAAKEQVALFEAHGFKTYREDPYTIGAMFMEYVYEKA
jgi:hypothetical protein